MVHGTRSGFSSLSTHEIKKHYYRTNHSIRPSIQGKLQVGKSDTLVSTAETNTRAEELQRTPSHVCKHTRPHNEATFSVYYIPLLKRNHRQTEREHRQRDRASRRPDSNMVAIV